MLSHRIFTRKLLWKALLLSQLILLPLANGTELKVALKQSPPFTYQEQEQWQGVSVELWKTVADQANYSYQFQSHESVAEMLDAVAQGRADIAIGAISVSAEREKQLDFTQPMYQAGLGIAARSQPAGWMSTVKSLFSWQFLSAVLALSVVLLLVGVLIWLLERKRNPEQFGGNTSAGIGNGFWWSAVTMTTVGYGDKAPITPAGRLLGLIWMFASIITISGFTAGIASSITVNKLQTRITGVSDLPQVQVAAVAETSGAAWLAGEGIHYRPYPDVKTALAAIREGDVDALVADAPLMRYLLQEEDYANVVVLPQLVRKESYAFAMANGSPLQETINRAMLEHMQTDQWQQLLNQNFGREQ